MYCNGIKCILLQRELKELADTSNPYFSLIWIQIRAQTNCSRPDQLHCSQPHWSDRTKAVTKTTLVANFC